MTDSAFWRAVALLAGLRIVPALLVLAADGRGLPLLPAARYAPPTGDTYGYHAAAREFISVWTRLSKPMLAVAALLVVTGAAGGWILWRSRRRPEAVALAALALGVFVTIGVDGMQQPGAPTVGWPIVWSLPLFPLRAAGVLGYHSAYYLGIAILLIGNLVTVVATALIARCLVPGRLALLAPSLLVAWPFLMRFVGGADAVYGSWLDDTGLALYSEPLATALVAAALAFLIQRRSDPLSAAVAGALLGCSTAVRVSNVTIVLVVFTWLVISTRLRSVVLFTAASAGGIGVAAAFWPLGYPTIPRDQLPDVLFSLDYVLPSWRDSPVFDWKMLLILLPSSILGFFAMRRRHREAWLLAAVVMITAAFYSPEYFTRLHPRFLFVALPPLFVLAAAGVDNLTRHIARPVSARADWSG